MEHCPEIKDADIRKFRLASKRLATVITDIIKYCPSARLYNTPGVLHLMCDVSHSDHGQIPQYENVVDEARIPTLSGGDW